MTATPPPTAFEIQADLTQLRESLRCQCVGDEECAAHSALARLAKVAMPPSDGYGGIPLRCPYCGDEIEVETSEQGYYRHVTVDAIICACGGRWSPSTGEVDAVPIANAACPTHGPHPMTVDCIDCLWADREGLPMTTTPPPETAPETTDELREIADYRRRLATPGMTAGEFAALLPRRLLQPYWGSKIREMADREGIDLDAD